MRSALALILTLLLGSVARLRAAEVTLSAVEASGGAEARPEEAVDKNIGKAASGWQPNGWRVMPGASQAAVFRAPSPLPKGNLRVGLDLFGKHGANHLEEFSLSVTDDPLPSLASHWEPLFPVILFTTKGELSRQGYRVRISGAPLQTTVRMDGILLHDATALRLDVWPAASAQEPSFLTELRAECTPLESTNIALGCPVTASHQVAAGQDPRFLTDGQVGTFAHPAMPHLPGPFYFEIDLGRVATLDHVSLVNRGEGGTMGRLSRIVLELFEEAPATGAKPVWKAQHRANGFSPEPGTTDAIYASAGQGRFHGRYLRISTESTVPFSPQIADVGMYESLVPSTIKASASGRALPNGREVQIPASAKWLTFSLVPPRLPGALRLGARARVVGVDSNWLPIGATDNLDYHGLPPGDYILEAQLRHTDQNWNQATIRMPIVVVEPWWQRPIAHVGAAVLAVVIGALVTRRIVRTRLNRRLVELERRQELSNERRRIARDMHDVVGSRLTQLAVMHELYADQSELPEEARGKLQELTRTAREAIASLDETVWAINPRNDTLEGLADYLCHVAGSYFQPLGIICRQDVQDAWPVLEVGAQKRHGVLNAFKEALQNIVKHAGATVVTLTLHLAGQRLFITLEDNGRGLPADLAGREKDGLENMSSRLAELGGTCQVSPGNNGGTRVEMQLPL
jgi:signal transduction histidine kinase